jgi:hypothetical protein
MNREEERARHASPLQDMAKAKRKEQDPGFIKAAQGINFFWNSR